MKQTGKRPDSAEKAVDCGKGGNSLLLFLAVCAVSSFALAVPFAPAFAQAPELSETLSDSPIPDVPPPADEAALAPPPALADAQEPVPLSAEPADDTVPALSDTLKGVMAPPAPDAANTAMPPVPAAEPAPETAAEPLSPGMILPVDEKTVEGLIAPGDRASEREAIRREAFEQSLDSLFPMRPGEIREVLKKFDETREAVEEPINPLPSPVVEFTTVPLDPGSEPLSFKLATGHVTTVTFLDMTGQPWPIQDVSWAGNFEVLQPEAGGNILRITPLGEHVYGNMSLRLVSLGTPLIFSLKTGRDVVQYRLDLQIPEAGPNARAPLFRGGNAPTVSAGSDRTLTELLEGIVPGDAVKLNVAGADGRTTAYRRKNVTYVRTPLTLLSPSWNASVRSADGMNVYALAVAPVLLLSDKGVMIRTTLSDPAPTGDAF